MLHPYTPFITEKLWSNIKFEGILTTHQRPTLLTLGEPNFKIKRLIDIVTELRNIRSQAQVKPHESVQIFIQGNKDILDFMGKYEELLQKLVKTHEILYIQQDEKTDPDYITSVIINMTV
jgi:valyl-tRNA synthetase